MGTQAVRITQTSWQYPSAGGMNTVHATLWLPDGEVKAVVQICHGMMEHILRYDRFARALCGRGYAVCGDDHLGHGRTAASREELGYFGPKDGDRHLAEDEHRLRLEMERRFPGKPYFLLGHSMGSFITRRVIAEHGEGLAGAICCGTAGRIPGLKIARVLAGVLTALGGGKRPGRLINWLAFHSYNSRVENPQTCMDWLTRDREGYPDPSGDDRLHFIFTNSGFGDMFRLLDSVNGLTWSRRVPPDLPVAVFSGDADPVGGYGRGLRQVAGWLRKAGVRDVTLRLYPGARHELHNELCRDEFLEELDGWMERHIQAQG